MKFYSSKILIFFFPFLHFSLQRTEKKDFAIGNCALRMCILGNSFGTEVLTNK